MRKVHWFVAGAAVAAGALAAVPIVRARLRGDEYDDLPPAVGLEPDAVVDVAAEAPASGVAEEPLEPVAAAPHTDEQADDLRGQIQETRTRMRSKAKAATVTDDEPTADQE